MERCEGGAVLERCEGDAVLARCEGGGRGGRRVETAPGGVGQGVGERVGGDALEQGVRWSGVGAAEAVGG